MKIAFVSVHELSSDLLAVARELSAAHRVTIYTRRDAADRKPRGKVATGVAIEYVDAGPARPLPETAVMPHVSAFSAHLRERWAKDRPDVVHAHSWTGGLAAVAAIDGLDVPIVQTFHAANPIGARPGDREAAARTKLERAIGRRANAVVASCASEAADLIRLGVPRRTIAVVPHGVDVERFRRQGPAGARGDRPRLLHVGHIGRGGGADVAIRALDGIPGAELVIAGGPRPDAPEAERDLERLTLLAKEAGVEDRVTLLGHVTHNAMPKLMRGADIVLTLPVAAPNGKVALEAMACGVPVIASAVGAHLDSVVEGVTGLLVRPQDPAALARRTRALLGDLTRRTALGFAGADRAGSRYSMERIGRELVRVYENVTGRARPVELDEAEAEAA
ncbi:glycosyl transferase [Sphaerisporangium siamense]|uniref:Glycosyltransferase involved in cell wall biosynthesis n=1 Tax=Sphaerisporangium siamense TaxID=795645 RepID=A0A7W7DD30_9ACTN|nr:glycosyltransferase [Sphaerisporangium siamense]MBB4704609.1 glycosyltransferase involved in cell wall biosynthesis [Sphaerisporangium siamense]GII86223.1 glycosyl transferase [Sphaerisporangium siamense]